MDFLGGLIVVFLALTGGVLMAAATGWRLGRDVGYMEGLRTDWNKADIEKHDVY